MKLVYGFNARALRDATQPEERLAVPLTLRDLETLGIPERKRARVQEELARLALQDNRLLDRKVLEELAKQLAKQLA